MAHIVYLGLGTNLGDRLANLHHAAQDLEPHVRVLARSRVYQTPPWGFADQPDFLNQALKVETDLDPRALLARLKEIERHLGRRETFRYGPRVIDLDILFFDDQVVDSHGLRIPHPQLHTRAFVLVPLADLAPELRHPSLGRTVSDLLAEVDTVGVEEYPSEPRSDERTSP